MTDRAEVLFTGQSVECREPARHGYLTSPKKITNRDGSSPTEYHALYEAAIQEDGNVVVRKFSSRGPSKPGFGDTVEWASNTSNQGRPPLSLQVGDNGTFSLVQTVPHKVVFTKGSPSKSGKYMLKMQDDGNLVLYYCPNGDERQATAETAVWSSKSENWRSP